MNQEGEQRSNLSPSTPPSLSDSEMEKIRLNQEKAKGKRRRKRPGRLERETFDESNETARTLFTQDNFEKDHEEEQTDQMAIDSTNPQGSQQRNQPPPRVESTTSNTNGSDHASETHVNLKVANAEGNEVFFKIKKTTPFRKLMRAYCKRQGLVRGAVRFTFDGNRIDPDNTPVDLKMVNQDVIDCMVEQTGGICNNFRQWQKKKRKIRGSFHPY